MKGRKTSRRSVSAGGGLRGQQCLGITPASCSDGVRNVRMKETSFSQGCSFNKHLLNLRLIPDSKLDHEAFSLFQRCLQLRGEDTGIEY